MSKELKNILLNGFSEDIRNPIRNGKLKFDKIAISNFNDRIGGVKVEFSWCGVSTLWIRGEGIEFKNDMTLNINGITGEQGFDIVM